MIAGVLEALQLKDVERAGWKRRGLSPVESVADHSWSVALLVLLLLPDDLDTRRALTYALLHDLAEAWIGDLTPYDDRSDKAAREEAAMRDFCARIKRPDLLQIWLDYEHQVDEEARFVKQLDKLEMALQARRYEQRGLDPSEFMASAERGLVHPRIREWFNAL